jgi:hypothetical protein
MEPARAGWSFNKWQKTRIPKQRRQRSQINRRRNGLGPAVAPVAAAEPEDAAVAAVVDVAALEAELAVAVALADRAR